MQFFKKEQILILLAAVGIFGWGLFTWFNAHFYQPAFTTTAPIKHNSGSIVTPKPSKKPLQTFLEGKMFFAKELPPTIEPPKSEAPVIPFISKLVVWGIISGSENRAVIGLNREENVETWILKAGDQLSGEKIVKINSDSILVKNETGIGKVKIVE